MHVISDMLTVPKRSMTADNYTTQPTFLTGVVKLQIDQDQPGEEKKELLHTVQKWQQSLLKAGRMSQPNLSHR